MAATQHTLLRPANDNRRIPYAWACVIRDMDAICPEAGDLARFGYDQGYTIPGFAAAVLRCA